MGVFGFCASVLMGFTSISSSERLRGDLLVAEHGEWRHKCLFPQVRHNQNCDVKRRGSKWMFQLTALEVELEAILTWPP